MSQKQKPKTDNAKFHIEFLNQAQKYAWSAFQQHDILFLIGPAGCGKSFLAMSFAINEILKKTKKKIFLTRPIVEAGESLGYLPGDFNEKVMPYMLPLYDSLNKLVGEHSPQRDAIDKVVEVAPLAYLRGRTFDSAIGILDEAQNCSIMQLKLFLTRMGNDSKLIITADPTQSDIANTGIREVLDKVSNIPGIATVYFKEESIVRHPLVAQIVKVI